MGCEGRSDQKRADGQKMPRSDHVVAGRSLWRSQECLGCRLYSQFGDERHDI